MYDGFFPCRFRLCVSESTENIDLEELSLKEANGQCTQSHMRFSDGSKTLK